MTHPVIPIAALGLALFAGGVRAQTLPTPPNVPPNVPFDATLMTLPVATQLVEASIAACEAKGEHPSALVMDADGNLRALMSADGGSSIGLYSSQHKARTVLDFKMSTRDAMTRLQSDKAFEDKYGKDERYFFHPGALPLYRGGKLVAVLAVGGGHQIDEDCAKDALAKVGGFTTAP